MLYHVPDLPNASRRFAGAVSGCLPVRGHQRSGPPARAVELLADFEGEPWLDRVTSRSFELENHPRRFLRSSPTSSYAAMKTGLAVTEAEPLVAYVLSTADPARPTRLARDPEAFR